MTAHKHAKMIKAKADNMDLVLLRKTPTSEYWEICRSDWMPTDLQDEFFLCLPQHKDACLHWLNGGDVKGRSTGSWIDYCPAIKADWNNCTSFMDSDFEIVIKPRKEKRWIALNSFGDVMPVHCKDLESAKQLAQYKGAGINGEVQYIEIEVEV